jgi:kynureninase
MAFTSQELYRTPNALAPYYSHFGVSERLLLTGHSHQAWPDRACQGQLQAWEDAAEYADLKWEKAFERAERVREGFRRLLDDPDGLYSLAASTHDLLVRFLSALPLAERPRLVVTDCEFHSLRRQVDRLAEAGIEIERIPSHPAESVGERLAAAVDDRTAAVMVSTVFYRDARIAGDLSAATEACRRHGAELLLDVYHQLGVVPFSLRQRQLEEAFVVGGGYKYCQLGEGNCFLRFPSGCRMRPVITGWFAEFGELSESQGSADRVRYDRGDQRFAGATYDPTSHYRAAEVFDFFAEHHLTPELLRQVSQHQVGLLARFLDESDLDQAVIRRDHDIPIEQLGGFLALHSPHAESLHHLLLERGVLTDYRDQRLRFGPAPYLSDTQLEESIALLAEAVRERTP